MNALVGTRRLIRLALRRDRITLPLTIVLVIAMVAGSAPALAATYPDTEKQVSYVASSAPSVVGRVFQGTVQGPNLGTIVMAETYLFSAVILAIMSIFIVSRHTRLNEETGAGELIGSTVVGRSAPLTAAVMHATLANVVTGAITFAALASVKELDVAGSAFMAASLASVGIFFVGVGAITVQLSDYRRGANGMAIAALGGFFLIRAVGDSIGEISASGLSVTAHWLTWLSPFGWGYQVLPYNGDRLLPLGLLWVGFVALMAIAYTLHGKRDIGSSIFQAKPGPARAHASLLSARGLAIRLQRGGLVGWAIGYAVFGAMIAVVANDFRETFEENETLQEFIAALGSGGSFVEAIIAAMFPLMAAMLSAYVVTSVSKMYEEEASGRVEFLLGTALGRARWLMSHVGFTVLGIFVTLSLMGAAGGLGYSLVAEDASVTAADVTIAALVNIPAMALFMSVIVLVYAWLGRFVRAFAWAAYAYVALIGSLGGIFSWPDWVNYLSPFVHTPPYPADSYDIMPLANMLMLATAGVLLSTVLFKRRDISLK